MVKSVDTYQWTNWQGVSWNVQWRSWLQQWSHRMVSLVVGWCGDQLLLSVRTSHVHSFLVSGWDSHVCVKGCELMEGEPACWHVVQKTTANRGMASTMVSLHSNHHTHAWWYTTLCVMFHHVFFLLLNPGWNSVAWRDGCCFCGVNALSVSLFARPNTCHCAFTKHRSKCETHHVWLWVWSENIECLLSLFFHSPHFSIFTIYA